MEAADWETFWRSFPSRMISSFWFLDSEMVTPSSMGISRTIFSPEGAKLGGEWKGSASGAKREGGSEGVATYRGSFGSRPTFHPHR